MSKNTYRLSDGSRITKSAIDRNIREAKQKVLEDQLNEHGANFCEQCHRSGFPVDMRNDLEFRILDCAHIKSVKECQESGQSELAFDPGNIRILCRFHHRKYDGNNLKFKKQ